MSHYYDSYGYPSFSGPAERIGQRSERFRDELATYEREKQERAVILQFTERGFLRGEFQDSNGETCSIQESSAAEGHFIWLGVDNPNPKQFPGDGTGWHDYPLPDNVQCTTRMHLSRKQVAELLPYLERFVETGEIDEGETP